MASGIILVGPIHTFYSWVGLTKTAWFLKLFRLRELIANMVRHSKTNRGSFFRSHLARRAWVTAVGHLWVTLRFRCVGHFHVRTCFEAEYVGTEHVWKKIFEMLLLLELLLELLMLLLLLPLYLPPLLQGYL